MFIRAAGEPAGEKIDAVSAPCGVVDAVVITLYLMKGKGRAIRLVKPFVRDKTCGLFLGDTPRPHFHCFRGDHRCSTFEFLVAIKCSQTASRLLDWDKYQV